MESNSFIQMQPGDNITGLALGSETLKQLRGVVSMVQLQEPATGQPTPVTNTAGWAVLFCGPAGSNQSLAAAALGKELGQTVYRVDLAAVVSKYIGETEKKLGRLFKNAAGKKAILFFDEADALFGKRTGIKDAHDRYANTEAAYLLQLLQTQEVLVIFSAKTRDNIDSASVRRLRAVVQF